MRILDRLRFGKPTISTASMAAALFDITTAASGQESLIKQADLPSLQGLELKKVRTEILFLNLATIYIAVFRFDVLNQLHHEKLSEMYLHYLAHFKRMIEPSGAGEEEQFLQLSESRLATYNKAYDLWRSNRENGAGHTQAFVIADAFFHFCGVPNYNPVSLFAVQHHFLTTTTEVGKQLRGCKLR